MQLWRTQIQTQSPDKVSHYLLLFLLLNMKLFLVTGFEFSLLALRGTYFLSIFCKQSCHLFWWPVGIMAKASKLKTSVPSKIFWELVFDTSLYRITNLRETISSCATNTWEIFDPRSLLLNIFLISAQLNFHRINKFGPNFRK